MNRAEVIRILSENLPELKKQYPIKSLALFGSVARGDNNENSDVDILVEFQEPVGYFTLGKIERRIIKLLGDIKVDLVPANSIREQFKTRIFGEAIYV